MRISIRGCNATPTAIAAATTTDTLTSGRTSFYGPGSVGGFQPPGYGYPGVYGQPGYGSPGFYGTARLRLPELRELRQLRRPQGPAAVAESQRS